MPEQENTEIVQLNLATEQRNAGRDYHEYFVPGSIKLVLATWSKEKLDAQALDNEVMFRYRFGFEPSKTVRQQLLEIRKQYDFTDRQICWLRRSGQLFIAPHEAKLKPSRLMPLIGWSQATLLGLMCAGMVLQIKLSTAPAWKQGLAEIVVAGLGFGVFWILNALYIEPWRTLKRSGALSSTARKG